MQARALKRLMQLTPSARLEAISEGLGLLAENVATLGADIDLLRGAGRGRSLWILARQAEEEAAKALILLDLARSDPRDQDAAARQLKHFYDHLARCIYAEVTQMSPADFAEVRRMVGSMRPELYLDGPEGFEWIFRNRLLTAREEGLYVDYVHDDDGERWVTPALSDEISFGGPSPAVRELVGSLTSLGAFDPRGLAIAASVWGQAELTEDTHWQEILARNRQVVDELIKAGLGEAASEEDTTRVIRSWTFPLSGLDLTMLEVSRAELEAKQERLAPA
jgi:AbiV family abortive infection protein